MRSSNRHGPGVGAKVPSKTLVRSVARKRTGSPVTVAGPILWTPWLSLRLAGKMLLGSFYIAGSSDQVIGQIKCMHPNCPFGERRFQSPGRYPGDDPLQVIASCFISPRCTHTHFHGRPSHRNAAHLPCSAWTPVISATVTAVPVYIVTTSNGAIGSKVTQGLRRASSLKPTVA